MTPPLTAPLGFKGRIGRGRWWKITLSCFAAALAVGGLVIFIGISVGSGMSDPIVISAAFIFIICMLAIMFTSFAAGVGRLHDRGKTGWWVLAYYLVPGWVFPAKFNSEATDFVLAAIALAMWGWVIFDLGIQKGDPGPNAFGPVPS